MFAFLKQCVYIKRMKNDAIELLKKHYGSQTAIAKRFDLLPMAITQWKKRGVPVKYCPQIEADTDGAVTCHQIRPDVFPAPKCDAVA